MSGEYILVDFAYHKPKFEYFKDGESVQQWSTKKKDAVDMICSVIDQQGLSGFDAAKLKGMTIRATELLNPKTVRIVKKV